LVSWLREKGQVGRQAQAMNDKEWWVANEKTRIAIAPTTHGHGPAGHTFAELALDDAVQPVGDGNSHCTSISRAGLSNTNDGPLNERRKKENGRQKQKQKLPLSLFSQHD
jgi:hypothetical protein